MKFSIRMHSILSRHAFAALATAMMVVPLVSGCSSFSSCGTCLTDSFGQSKADHMAKCHARSAAIDAWDCNFARCYRHDCNADGIRAGFIAGYVDGCMGGGDCPPMFAPLSNGFLCHGHHYCSTSWHNGYPLGAAEAAACGGNKDYCPRVHPCLMSMERPVNPGCIRIEDYQATHAPTPEVAPHEVEGHSPVPVTIPPTAKNTDAEPESVFGSASGESVALGEVCQPLLAIMLGNE